MHKIANSDDTMLAKRPSRKRIVLCSDGAGNCGGKSEGTNVWRLYSYLDINDYLRDPRLMQQIVFYDSRLAADGTALPSYVEREFEG